MRLLVSAFLLLSVNLTFGQSFLKITNGFGAIQIKISNSEQGKLYYVVYKTDPVTFPSAADIKTIATNTVVTNVEKKGFIPLNQNNLGDTLTQNILGIPVVTDNSTKTLFIYAVFESASGAFGTIVKQSLSFNRKQRAYTFQSTTLTPGSLIKVNYLVYLPETYFHDISSKKYPMIVFFHGDGEKGDNVDNLRYQALPQDLDNLALGLNLDFIVVSPQQNGWQQTWDKPSFIQELVDLMKAQYRIDEEKIYGIGCSGGGGGMYTYSSNYPTVFSAISPMSGVNSFFNQTNPNYCLIKDIPFWGFHSISDWTVTLNNMVSVINNVTVCGPIIPMTKTTYPGTNHLCWQVPLKQDSIYRFFLARSKSFKTNSVQHIVFDTNYTVIKDVSTGIATIDISTLVKNANYNYTWYQKSGADVAIKDQNTPILKLVEPSNGKYKFRLLLDKNNGNVNYRDVVITVQANTVTKIEEEYLLKKVSSNWEIFDLQGIRVRKGANSIPNVDYLKTGVYIVQSEGKSHKIYVD